MSKVIIKVNIAADPFLSQILDTKAKQAILPDVFKKIGSERITGSDDIIRGLPPLLEEVLMPSYLGISRNTDNYDKLVKDFWAEFEVKIYANRPVELNMATKKETRLVNGKEVELDVPVNLYEYMQGYFALQSSQVAKNEYEKSNVDIYRFILEDLQEAKQAEVDTINEDTLAMKYYVELVTNIESSKVTEIMQMLMAKEGLNIYYNMTTEDKKIQLNKILKLYPADLIKLAQDTNLTLKAKVRFALDNSILSKEGDTFFLTGDDVPLARGIKEMLSVFSDPHKALQVSKINAKIEQLTKIKN